MILIFVSITTHGQKALFIGKVTDSIGRPLFGANILLLDSKNIVKPAFGSTDKYGNFKIAIEIGINYNLRLSFLGFNPVEREIIADSKELELKFILQESLNLLEEITLKYKPPIQVKKDTTIYQVDSFATGRERKLGELLKKLPGLEVTRDGSVLINDKKITIVLVEGKTFFNGKTKLAVENIPADAIAEVQIIEDYHEVFFLKGLLDSEELAMNLVLKEDKKKFAFGDLNSAAGLKSRYRFNPSIFNYSTKNISNIIGDINNTPDRSFTLGDYLSFQGEYTPEKFEEVLNSPVYQFLSDDDFFDNRHQFVGINNQWNPSEKDELRTFFIALDDNIRTLNSLKNTYITDQTFEERFNEQTSNQKIYFGKIHYRFTPKETFDMKMSTQFNLSQIEGVENNTSNTGLNGLNEYHRLNNRDEKGLDFSLETAKFFSEKNTATSSLKYNYDYFNELEIWQSLNNIFSDTLNLMETDNYSVEVPKTQTINSFQLSLADYFRPSHSDLLTFEVNTRFNHTSLSLEAKQGFENGSANGLSSFQNIISSSFGESIAGATYEKLIDQFKLSFGFKYQYQYWIDERNNLRNSASSNNFLPKLKVEWEPKEKLNLSFSYFRSMYAPSTNRRVISLALDDFNSIYNGNFDLTSYYSEKYVLKASSFKPYGLSFSGTLSHGQNRDPIINSFSFSGIQGITSPVQIDENGTSLSARNLISYRRPYWKISQRNSWNFRESPNIYNGQKFNNTFHGLTNTLQLETLFEEFPNIAVELSNNKNMNKNGLFSNTTNVLRLDAGLNLNIKSFKLEADGVQTWFENITQNSSFSYNQINLSLYHRATDSPWEFGIKINNLGNSKRLIMNRFNQQLFRETSSNLFPRIFLVNVSLKL